MKPARPERLRRSGATALTATLVWAGLAAVTALADCAAYQALLQSLATSA